MTPSEILALSAMPPANPSYPRGPYRFVNREYLIITYETDPEAIRAMVPDPLEPDGSGHVHYEWIAMPDSSGFGSYHESGVVIPCLWKGEPVNYTAMMFLNDEPPISAGREIWGFPKRWGEPRLEVRADTLTGTLAYGGERVAMGTMTYKYEDRMAPDPSKRGAHLRKTSVNLKIIPCVTGGTRIVELVSYNLTDIHMHFHFSGPARLHLIPHINCRVALKCGIRKSTGSGQNMGVVVGDLDCAKVSSLRGGLPWTYGLQSKRPSIMGRSALISLTAFLDRTG